MKVYLELMADGTVPLSVKVSRNVPFVLQHESADPGYWSDEEGTYRVYELELVDPDEYERSGLSGVIRTVYLSLTWVDDEGFSAVVYTDPVAAAVATFGGFQNYEDPHTANHDEPEVISRGHAAVSGLWRGEDYGHKAYSHLFAVDLDGPARAE